MKPQDLAVGLQLASAGPAPFAALASGLGLSASEAHAAVKRLQLAGLVNAERQVVRHALHEFVVHGVKYVFPVQPGALSLGVPTGAAAPALQKTFPLPDPPWVWPSPDGNARGMSLPPLYRSIPAAALRDPKLYELLALVDALRAGRAREKKLAERRLTELLL